MLSRERPGSKTRTRVREVRADRSVERTDYLATEEPMEIRLRTTASVRPVAVTMRTPGADFELAAGFLFSEGLISRREDIRAISYCTDPQLRPDHHDNVVTVTLAGGLEPDLGPLERHFSMTSACGVCGKASLEALHLRGCPSLSPGPRVEPEVLRRLPERLGEAQGIFRSTGGLHAAGLFTPEGELVALREDVGRHNAVDKLVGWGLLEGRLPFRDYLVMVSGRAGFEILQKCLTAEVPVLCAVSAPSSLAVAVAEEFGMTLVGFLRGERFNIYAGDQRIASEADG